MGAVKKIKKPEVFSFHDYRDFLRAHFEYIKVTEHISIRKISIIAGLAAGYLPMVLSGKRELSMKALVALEPHLGLNTQEYSHLQDLIELGSANNFEEKARVYSRIQTQPEYKRRHTGELVAHYLLKHWYHAAIIELVRLKSFKEDLRWIQKKLKKRVAIAQLREALDFLIEEKFLERGSSGRLKLANRSIDCHGGVYKIAMGGFHKQMLGLAADSILNTPSEDRNLLTHTMSIDKNQFIEIKNIIDDALKKIQAVGDRAKNPEEVYQISLLTFPLTSSEGGSDESE